MTRKNDINIRMNIESPGMSHVIRHKMLSGVFVVPIETFSDQNAMTCSLKYVGDPEDEMTMLFGMWREVTGKLASSKRLSRRARVLFTAVLRTVTKELSK